MRSMGKIRLLHCSLATAKARLWKEGYAADEVAGAEDELRRKLKIINCRQLEHQDCVLVAGQSPRRQLAAPPKGRR